MKELFSVIRDRRSIRKYQNKPVSRELIEEVLVAAGWAPSAHNAQPWRFIILTEDRAKKELSKTMARVWAADLAKDGVKIDEEVRKVRVERFGSAPVLILACLTMEDMNNQHDIERQVVEHDLAIQSLGAAIQNLLLTAYAEGLGACWFCAPGFCKAAVRTVLKIPENVEPQALIALGFPAESPIVPPRRLLGDYCFKNKWGKKF